MKVAELLQQRQKKWRELEKLCDTIGEKSDPSRKEYVTRFSALYRAACADLALAESNQLPPATVGYLHQLVAKAHNQLYRSERYQFRKWYRTIFHDTPRQIFHDPCVHIVAVLFWGLFLISAYLAYDNSVWPGFAQDVVGQEQLDSAVDMYTGFAGRGSGENWLMFGFYIFNNAGIGLNCFVWMLFVLPGFVTLAFNSVQLGTVFGYMFRPEVGEAGNNFKNFVTAHGPFELTAIVLSAGAGLKIGLGWLITGGLSRMDSLRKAGRDALPIAMTAVALFCMAAAIEGLISATPEKNMSWFYKGCVATFTSFLLTFYFVVLGFPEPGDPDVDFLLGAWMKLDETFISIRKRSVSELFDLSLTIVRGHWRSLLILLMLGAAPWILLDLILLWPLMHYGHGDPSRWACSWLMVLLVVNQAQYGTSLITLYLGEAMFIGKPDWKKAARQAIRVTFPFGWLHGCLRMVFPVAWLVWMLDVEDPNDSGVLIGLFIPSAVALGLAFRAFRPFVSEMILLEETPWRPKDKNTVSFSRRSRALHSYASSELFGRFVLSCLFAAPLAITFQSLFVQVDSLLNLSAGSEWTLASYYWVISLWLTAGFVAVFRFLSYIDIRIRQEGWAIELKMRAEGQKLAAG